MRKLLDFLIRKRHWWLFILLEIASFTLVLRYNAYQRNVMVSSANVVTGHIAAISGAVTAYLNLRDINRELLERNGELEMQVLALRQQQNRYVAGSAVSTGYASDSTDTFGYAFITAKVVNNSVTRLSNYITLDKGTKDGVAIDMGVVSERGVVGIVSTVGERFSVVIPLLNPKLRLSGKLLGGNYFGSVYWNGRDIRHVNLDELPRHVDFQVGDTIVTSGFSSVFPEGIIIGTIHKYERRYDDNFNSFEVELATDFQALNNVRIIRNYNQAEQRQVEQEAKRHDQ